jgi:hypothetical protein
MHTYGMIQADGQCRIVLGTREEALKAYHEHDCHGLRVMEAPIGAGTDYPVIDWPTFLALSRRCYAGD